MKRFIIQSSEKPNFWVVTDQVNKIVVIFQNKQFNETQKVINLEDIPLAKMQKLASINREIAEWLLKNHREKI